MASLPFWGIVMLGAAYAMAIQGIAWQTAPMMMLTLALGLFGTILLFYGMRAFIALLVKTGKSKRKLYVFNFRQIQETSSSSLPLWPSASLLILTALCCFGAGIGIATTGSQLIRMCWIILSSGIARKTKRIRINFHKCAVCAKRRRTGR